MQWRREELPEAGSQLFGWLISKRTDLLTTTTRFNCNWSGGRIFYRPRTKALACETNIGGYELTWIYARMASNQFRAKRSCGVGANVYLLLSDVEFVTIKEEKRKGGGAYCSPRHSCVCMRCWTFEVLDAADSSQFDTFRWGRCWTF